MEQIAQFPLRMSKSMQHKIVSVYQQDNCSSQNEFILKALSFYISYLEVNNVTPVLSEAIVTSIQGALEVAENRSATNLFRLAVEIDMMMHLLAASLDITDDELRALRGRCVGEVKKTKGKVKFDDAVAFQQSDS